MLNENTNKAIITKVISLFVCLVRQTTASAAIDAASKKSAIFPNTVEKNVINPILPFICFRSIPLFLRYFRLNTLESITDRTAIINDAQKILPSEAAFHARL